LTYWTIKAMRFQRETRHNKASGSPQVGCRGSYLYTARVSVKKEGKTIDCKDVEFGLRSISFSPEEGFLLNGKGSQP